MTAPRLTPFAPAATTPPMQGKVVGVKKGRWILPLLMAGSATLGGCIQIDAPTEPIVIELNINITQEVIYRLAADAEGTIEENADIF